MTYQTLTDLIAVLQEKAAAFPSPEQTPEYLAARALAAFPTALREAFREGERTIAWRYAWWKDGVEYVGCGLRTRADVVQEIAQDSPHVCEDLFCFRVYTDAPFCDCRSRGVA